MRALGRLTRLTRLEIDRNKGVIDGNLSHLQPLALLRVLKLDSCRHVPLR